MERMILRVGVHKSTNDEALHMLLRHLKNFKKPVTVDVQSDSLTDSDKETVCAMITIDTDPNETRTNELCYGTAFIADFEDGGTPDGLRDFFENLFKTLDCVPGFSDTFDKDSFISYTKQYTFDWVADRGREATSKAAVAQAAAFRGFVESLQKSMREGAKNCVNYASKYPKVNRIPSGSFKECMRDAFIPQLIAIRSAFPNFFVHGNYFELISAIATAAIVLELEIQKCKYDYFGNESHAEVTKEDTEWILETFRTAYINEIKWLKH